MPRNPSDTTTTEPSDPARPPEQHEQPELIVGELVELRPLVPDDATDLFASATDPEVWRWKLVPRPRSVADLEQLIAGRTGPQRWQFLISRRSDGAAIGSTTLANFDWAHGCVEMGFTWLDRSCWGQGYNEDSKHALLRHCFETLPVVRVEWQVDECNERSVAALIRLGFVYEGTLRSRHVRPDGTRRNSLYFSTLLEEWPDTAGRLAALTRARSAPPPHVTD